MKKSHILRTITAFTMAFSLVFLNLPSVRADDSDIFGANIEPNVMILIDSSGSMGNSITSTSYDSSTTYGGSFSSGVVYRRINDDYSLYKNTVDEVPNDKAKTALNLAGFWTGMIGGSTANVYLGNYLNFQNCTSCTGSEKKIDIAKKVVTDLINYVEGVRFGVMKFKNNGSKGSGNGDLIGPIGMDKADMIAAVNAINPSNWTPTGEQLEDAGSYYKGDFESNDSPVQYECQPNFAIVISDGLENGTLKVANVATNRFTQDHCSSSTNCPLEADGSAFAGLQNVIVHTVGFDLAGTDDDSKAANDALKAAAANGGGQFFAANNSAELAASLQDAIRLIIGAVFTFATPVVPTTSATGSTRAYIAAVQSDPEINFWRGYLKAYDRDTDGTIRLNSDGTPDATYLAWEAGQVLTGRASADRNIYMEKIKDAIGSFTGQRIDFISSNVKKSVLGVGTNQEATDIVNFVRGVDVYDEDGDGNVTEDRAWKLGDIFHSTPVLVSPPLLPIADASYETFRQAQANRPTVLIVGANDGMIHAFAEKDYPGLTPPLVEGEEVWAYVPFNSIGQLKDLTTISGDHPFFVDSSPIATDIKIGDDWKTIVIFGLRRGGSSYYALDVTDTTDPYMLWKNSDGAGIGFTDSKMGETWSEPAIGKIKWTDGSDKYVAFMGGGYDTGENNAFGKAFFMLDLATGQVLGEYYNDGTSDDRQYMNFSLAANPTAVDVDADGYIDRVYIGDVGGQMWKFEPTVTPGTTAPTTYRYEFTDDNGTVMQRDFTYEIDSNKLSEVQLKIASEQDQPLAWPVPESCKPSCYIFQDDPNKDPYEESHDYHLGFVGDLDVNIYGSGTTIYNLSFLGTGGGNTNATFALNGKRLFSADPSQSNPPAAGEYFPAQAIYSAPSVASDSMGNIWVSFGTGDRNRPLNTSTNRFYGIKDNTSMTNGNALTESNLQKIDSSVSSVSTSIQGWYFTLAANEKVLAQADTFNNTVFFTTFTPESTAVCGGGGGTARLYAVSLTSGMASMDFDTGDALMSTSGGALKSTVIGTGIPSKPAIMIDPNGNPSVVTGTTSQQISSVPAPPISTKQLLGWREVF